MRDPNRLDGFYEKLREYHKAYFPDMRFAQLMSSFFSWANTDGFYWEETKFLEKFKEYIDSTGAAEDKPKVIYEDNDITPAIIYIPKRCIGLEVTAKIFNGDKTVKAVTTLDTEDVYDARVNGDEYEADHTFYRLTDKAEEELGL